MNGRPLVTPDHAAPLHGGEEHAGAHLGVRPPAPSGPPAPCCTGLGDAEHSLPLCRPILSPDPSARRRTGLYDQRAAHGLPPRGDGGQATPDHVAAIRVVGEAVRAVDTFHPIAFTHEEPLATDREDPLGWARWMMIPVQWQWSEEEPLATDRGLLSRLPPAPPEARAREALQEAEEEQEPGPEAHAPSDAAGRARVALRSAWAARVLTAAVELRAARRAFSALASGSDWTVAQGAEARARVRNAERTLLAVALGDLPE